MAALIHSTPPSSSSWAEVGLEELQIIPDFQRVYHSLSRTPVVHPDDASHPLETADALQHHFWIQRAFLLRNLTDTRTSSHQPSERDQMKMIAFSF